MENLDDDRNAEQTGNNITEEMKYYFGFRQTIPAPPGQWIVCGPYDTHDQAMSARQNSKAWDCHVTAPFVASSVEEAENKVHIF